MGRTQARRSFWSVSRPSPEDIEGMKAAQGILTVRGGMTSHAAVVARGMGTCCVSGCGAIAMDEANKTVRLSQARPTTRAIISPSTAPPATSMTVLSPPSMLPSPASSAASWAGLTSTAVCRSAPTPILLTTHARHVSLAHRASACTRTEHMFFDSDRIAAFREMICSDTKEERVAALAKLDADAAGRLRGHLRSNGRLPRDHPLPRSSAP